MFIEFVSLDSGERTNIKMALLYLDGKEPTQNLGIGSASALNLCSGQQRLKRDTGKCTHVLIVSLPGCTQRGRTVRLPL